MWTPENRRRYDRSRLRYPSDLPDEEWSHVAPLIPPGVPATPFLIGPTDTAGHTR
jgi:hypothetical protein